MRAAAAAAAAAARAASIQVEKLTLPGPLAHWHWPLQFEFSLFPEGSDLCMEQIRSVPPASAPAIPLSASLSGLRSCMRTEAGSLGPNLKPTS
eukprot:3660439-Rhodomonas_salina.1